MDPEETLRQAAHLLYTQDVMDLAVYLEAYREWRAKGGFEPVDGDKRYASILESVGEPLASRSRFVAKLRNLLMPIREVVSDGGADERSVDARSALQEILDLLDKET